MPIAVTTPLFSGAMAAFTTPLTRAAVESGACCCLEDDVRPFAPVLALPGAARFGGMMHKGFAQETAMNAVRETIDRSYATIRFSI